MLHPIIFLFLYQRKHGSLKRIFYRLIFKYSLNRFLNDIRVVDFAGELKPWQLIFNPENEHLSGNLTGQGDIQRDFLVSWWRIMHWLVIQRLNQGYSTSFSLINMIFLFKFYQSNSNNETMNEQVSELFIDR